jgi:hypothetical protein
MIVDVALRHALHAVDSHVLKFVSRAEQLQLRGRRNFDRYMRVVKKYVAFDSAEHAQWQKESAEDAMWDAEWKKRHGPVPGGARILNCDTKESSVRDS